MTQAELYSFMARNRYGVAASISPEGTPQSALVGIAVTPSLEVIFDTLRTSRKYRNLMRRPACSFVIGWSGEQTVQLEGDAAQPAGADLTRFQESYFATWPDGRTRLHWPDIVHLVVRPRWIRFTDYEQTPLFSQEFRCSEDGTVLGL